MNPTGFRRIANSSTTVTKKNSSPGRARHKPSTHCAGKAGCSPLDLYAHVRLSTQFAHETAGAARTRSSLRPLFGEGGSG